MVMQIKLIVVVVVVAPKKKNEEKIDYIMIIVRHVCLFPKARWFWLYERGAPHVLS